jgi:hypothetical protein
LNGETEPLNDSDADLVATLIKENTKAVNQGEYSEAELEMLCAFATPETIKDQADKGFLVLLFSDHSYIYPVNEKCYTYIIICYRFSRFYFHPFRA